MTDTNGSTTGALPSIDDINAMLTNHELSGRAADIARVCLREAGESDQRRAKLATLARLVLNQSDEASVMAEGIERGGEDRGAGGELAIAELHIAKGRARLISTGWFSYVIGMQSLHMLDDHGVINYIDMHFATPAPDPKAFIVTVQRLERPTAHDLRRAAEDRELAAKAQVADALSRLTEAASLTEGLRAVIDTLQRCDLDASGAFAMWRLDDFTVACDACREKSNAQSKPCRAEREMSYAPALRALLAHPAWFALTNGYGQ